MERDDLTRAVFKYFKILPPKAKSECGPELIPQDQFFYYALIPTAISVAVLALLQRRRWKWLDALDGRPGVPCPINFLECQDNRLAYVAGFGLTSWTAWDALTGDIPFKWSNENHFVRNFARLSACLMSALICYPIFGSIASDHFVGYAVGSVYIWMYSVVYFLSNYPCARDGQFTFVVQLLQIVPALICMFYLCFNLPWRCVSRVLENRRFKTLEHLSVSEDIKRTNAYKYVRGLLAANRLEGIAARRRVIDIARRKLYKNIPGFRYSLSLLVAVLVSVQFVYVGSLDMIKFYSSLIDRLHSPMVPAMNASDLITEYLVARGLRINFKHVVSEYHVWLDAFEGSCYVSTILSFLLTASALLLTLRGYRWHLLLLYRGQRLRMIPTLEVGAKPTYILAQAVRYVGFQFGYAIWGFVYQAALLLVVCCSLSTLYLVCFRYDHLWAVCKSFINVIGPIVVYFFGLLIAQRVLVRLFFLQRDERRNFVLAFDNRRLLWNFQYFMVFANSTMGLVSCFIRIFKALFFGAWSLPRLDVSMMSRHFERFDKGYAAYAALLSIESCHTNPVMVTFTNLLLPARGNWKYNAEEPLREIIQPTGRLKSMLSKTVRNRWHLYVTLHHNPGLRLFRKEAIKINRLMHAEEVILDDTLIEAPRLRLISRRFSERRDK